MPINQLPVELIRSIFEMSLQSPIIAPSPLPRNERRASQHQIHRTRRPTTTPIHLSVVCRHWRTITLSMPTLWSCWTVYGPDPVDITMFDLWLARSGNEMLDLTIHAGDDSHLEYTSVSAERAILEKSATTPQEDALVAILRRAIQESIRWKRVSFSFSDRIGQVFQSNYFTTRPSVPNLEAFELDIRETTLSGPPIIHTLGRVLCTSPKIRSAAWKAPVNFEGSDSSYIPFERLTALRFDYLSHQTALEILPRCHTLEYLSIGQFGSLDMGSFSPSGTEMEVDRVTLPCLKTLSINCLDEARTVHHFFKRFLAPSLQDLQLNLGLGETYGSPEAWTALIEFLQESGSTLNTFSFARKLEPLETKRKEAELGRYLKAKPFSRLVESPWLTQSEGWKGERQPYC